MSFQDDLRATARQTAERVARAHGIDVSDALNAAARSVEIIAARHAIFFELHTRLGWSGNRIAGLLGFDPSGVNRALSKVRQCG